MAMDKTMDLLTEFLGEWYDITKKEDKLAISSWEDITVQSNNEAVMDGVYLEPTLGKDKASLANNLWSPLLKKFQKLKVKNVELDGVCPFLISESLSDALVNSDTIPEDMKLGLTLNPLLVCHSVLASRAIRNNNTKRKVKISIELTPETLKFTRPPPKSIPCPHTKKLNLNVVISIKDQGRVNIVDRQNFYKTLSQELTKLPCVCDLKIKSGDHQGFNADWVTNMRCIGNQHYTSSKTM